MLIFIKKKYPFIIILLLLLFYGINNYIWLGLNKLPPTSDEASHLLSNLRYLNILTKPGADTFSKLLKVDTFYPPFFHFCAAIVNLIFGHSIIKSIMTNMLFSAVLFFSIFYIGRKWEDENTGLFAVFIVAMYPYIFGLSKMFMLEFALTAIVCFSFCCLLYADNFSHKIYSALFGMSLGFGMLIKPTFIFFLIGPLIVTILSIFLNHKFLSIRKKAMLNLGIAFIISIIIGGSWYFLRFFDRWYQHMWTGHYSVFGSVGIFTSFIYFFKLLILDQIAPFFSLLFFVGLILLLKAKHKLDFLFNLLLWFIIPYVIFTLINVRVMYYTVANLPAVALITSGGLLKIRNRSLKRCIVFIIVVWGLFQYCIISYTTPASVKMRVSFPTTMKIRNSFFSEETSYKPSQPCHILPITDSFYHFPRQGDWKLDEIIRVIENNNPGHKKLCIGVTDASLECKKVSWFDPDPRVLGTSWHDNFLITSNTAVRYFVEARNLPYTVISLLYSKDWINSPVLDFLVSVKQIEDIAPAIARYYELILGTTIPDGSSVYVYKKIFTK